MQHHFLSHKSSQVSYYSSGTGPEIALCFHGYGEDGMLYHFFEKHAGNQYSFYAIDMPFHGQTKWNEGLMFTQDDLSQIIKEILKRHKKTEMQLLTLIGFSLGGRIALSYYQAHPEMIKKIVLFAPDGLKVNFWYWLSTQTLLGKKLFAFSMKKPGWFFSFLKILNKMGLVNASIFKFVNYYIGNAEARRSLYQRWITLRKLKPNLEKIKSVISLQKTPVRLVYGKYDRIILPVRGEKFQKGIENYCTVSVINSGHQVVHENHADQLLPSLLD
jgi:pimeloyl-ACP methyl ester carboxylesterase